jgi:hypothetical protein
VAGGEAVALLAEASPGGAAGAGVFLATRAVAVAPHQELVLVGLETSDLAGRFSGRRRADS